MSRIEPINTLERRPTVVERLLGGSTGGVLLRLVILSFIVGVIMRALNVDPTDIIVWMEDRARYLSTLGVDSVAEAFRIIFVGAVIVVPVWAVMRLLKIISR